MPDFGSHLSIAGGYWKAPAKAAELGFASLQIFTKNNNQWQGKPLTDADVSAFVDGVRAARLKSVVAHNSYLINLASPDDSLWEKSIAAIIDELRRANRFGIVDVVAHPGAHVGAGEEYGLRRIVAGLNRAFAATEDIDARIALEITAGQGSCLGHRFEHLAAIIDGVDSPHRLSVCLDTCHMFAAGYPLAPAAKYRKTMAAFAACIDLDRLKVMHLNDSKRELGSRVDRHEHIGKGAIGLEAFSLVVNDRRFRDVPMILETAKEIDLDTGRDWDEINLAVLNGLVTKRK